jgi:hypothetical protein
MARSPKEAGKMVDTPKYNPNGGFPDTGAISGSNKPQPGSGLEQIDGAGTQSGAHPAKTQSKIMRYI